MNFKKAKRQQLDRHKQQCYHQRANPRKQEKLGTEASQQIGYTTWLPNNLPDIAVIEEKQLILLLIMQMVRIDQSEEKENSHTKEERTQRLASE